jgi:hypothetical protein
MEEIMSTVSKQLLKDAIEFIRRDGHISDTLASDANSYIDEITEEYYLEVNYSDFDQATSVNSVFDDANRQTTYSLAGTDELITNTISLLDIKLKGIKLKATEQDVQIQLSTDDGVTYFNIDSYDICESINSATCRFKILVPGTNTIKGLILLYENQI